MGVRWCERSHFPMEKIKDDVVLVVEEDENDNENKDGDGDGGEEGIIVVWTGQDLNELGWVGRANFDK